MYAVTAWNNLASGVRHRHVCDRLQHGEEGRGAVDARGLVHQETKDAAKGLVTLHKSRCPLMG